MSQNGKGGGKKKTRWRRALAPMIARASVHPGASLKLPLVTSRNGSVIDEVLLRAPKILPLGRAATRSSLLLRPRGIALVAAVLRIAATDAR
jgi:hypothetical protein